MAWRLYIVSVCKVGATQIGFPLPLSTNVCIENNTTYTYYPCGRMPRTIDLYNFIWTSNQTNVCYNVSWGKRGSSCTGKRKERLVDDGIVNTEYLLLLRLESNCFKLERSLHAWGVTQVPLNKHSLCTNHSHHRMATKLQSLVLPNPSGLQRVEYIALELNLMVMTNCFSECTYADCQVNNSCKLT